MVRLAVVTKDARSISMTKEKMKTMGFPVATHSQTPKTGPTTIPRYTALFIAEGRFR
jgi:hypothetical protein